MVYMSKKKRRRVMRKRILGLAITAVVIVGIFVTIWQVGLGSTLATVGGTSIRSGMVDGVQGYLYYIQYGTFPDYSTRGMTAEEKAETEDWIEIERNYYLNNILVPLEALKQHFAAQGKAFPSEEYLEDINSGVDSVFSDVSVVRVFNQKGIKKEHVRAYYEYLAGMEMYREEVLESNPVTDEEAREYYDENIYYFTTPASFKASHILLLDADHTPERLSEIMVLLERLRAGEDFAKLAMEYSEDTTAENGGDLGTFYTGYMVEPFEEACIALAPGEISDIVETVYGYHIIKMHEKTDEIIESLEEVRESIDYVLGNRRVTEAVKLLTENANIVYKVLVNPTTGRPPVSMDELKEARGIVDEPDGEDGEGHDHDDHSECDHD